MSNSNSHPSSTRQLPDRPQLQQLRKQAKELRSSFRDGEQNAKHEVATFDRVADPDNFKLTDAQRVLARAYGFSSWKQLKLHVDSLNFGEFCKAVTTGDVARTKSLVEARPELIHLEGGFEHGEQLAIHTAVLNRDSEMTRLLMLTGSNAQKGIWPHRGATTALTLATERGFDEIVAIIDEYEQKRLEQTTTQPTEDVSDKDSEPEEVLVTDATEKTSAQSSQAELSRAAVESGNLNAVRDLHQNSQLVSEIDFYQGGLLSLAVRNDNREMFELLIECGLDLDESVSRPTAYGTEHSSGMPLWFASCYGRYEMAERLIDLGCDIDAVVHASGCALSNPKDKKMRELLLERGARVTIEHVASWRDIKTAMRILDGSAAAQSMNTSEGQSGDGNANPEIARQFLWIATFRGVPEIVKRCLEVVDRPSDDSWWNYVLIQPMRFGNLDLDNLPENVTKQDFFECFRLLLAHNINPDVMSGGFTVLHHIATTRRTNEQERVKFARMLLEAGASLDVNDSLLKSTPLGWACRWGRAELVELYLNRGARVDEPNTEPWALPLAHARRAGHDEIVKKLEIGGRS